MKMRIYLLVPSIILLTILVSAGCNDNEPDSGDYFRAVHTAYVERDGPTYTNLLRIALYDAHRLKPGKCIERQQQLIGFAENEGFDGLESLWLIYQDCAAASVKDQDVSERLSNAERLQTTVRFRDEPAQHLPQRVSHWNSTVERGVRSDAVRSVFSVLLPKGTTTEG